MTTWENPKKILVILAHPDDPEFFCGGAIARWIEEGHQVNYVLFTVGEKGINDTFQDSKNIIQLRKKEQASAAEVLGVSSIEYLGYADGALFPCLEAQKDVVREIRKNKPDIVVSCDPTNYYLNDDYINHPDHRYAGQIVIDAVFPAAQNKLYFPELLVEGFEPHTVDEVWLSLPKDANTFIDVTATWCKKVEALEKHESQIGDKDTFRKHMNSKAIPTEADEKPRFEEKFNRIVFSRK